MLPKETSEYVGVGWHTHSSKWRARVWEPSHDDGKKGKLHDLGLFPTEFEAAQAVNKKCRELGIRCVLTTVESRPIYRTSLGQVFVVTLRQLMS